jgi:hypothetical protein
MVEADDAVEAPGESPHYGRANPSTRVCDKNDTIRFSIAVPPIRAFRLCNPLSVQVVVRAAMTKYVQSIQTKDNVTLKIR